MSIAHLEGRARRLRSTSCLIDSRALTVRDGRKEVAGQGAGCPIA